MTNKALRARLKQRAVAVLEADAETDGFADDVATILGLEDVSEGVLNTAQRYYFSLAKRLNKT